jgi:hypothetical protein
MRLFLIFLCLLPGPVFAACRSNTFGSVTQTQCDDGSSYNSLPHPSEIVARVWRVRPSTLEEREPQVLSIRNARGDVGS